MANPSALVPTRLLQEYALRELESLASIDDPRSQSLRTSLYKWLREDIPCLRSYVAYLESTTQPSVSPGDEAGCPCNDESLSQLEPGPGKRDNFGNEGSVQGTSMGDTSQKGDANRRDGTEGEGDLGDVNTKPADDEGGEPNETIIGTDSGADCADASSIHGMKPTSPRTPEMPHRDRITDPSNGHSDSQLELDLMDGEMAVGATNGVATTLTPMTQQPMGAQIGLDLNTTKNAASKHLAGGDTSADARADLGWKGNDRLGGGDVVSPEREAGDGVQAVEGEAVILGQEDVSDDSPAASLVSGEAVLTTQPPVDGRVDSDPNASQIRVSNHSEERDTRLDTRVGHDKEASDSIDDVAVATQRVETGSGGQTNEGKTIITGMGDYGHILPATDLVDKAVALATLTEMDTIDSDPNITGSRVSNHLEDIDMPIDTNADLSRQENDPLGGNEAAFQEEEASGGVQAVVGGEAVILGQEDTSGDSLAASLVSEEVVLTTRPSTDGRVDSDPNASQTRVSNHSEERDTRLDARVGHDKEASDSIDDVAVATQRVETGSGGQTNEGKTIITGMGDYGHILPATGLVDKAVALATLTEMDTIDSDPNITGSRVSNHPEDRDTPIDTNADLSWQENDPLGDNEVVSQEEEASGGVQAVVGGEAVILGQEATSGDSLAASLVSEEVVLTTWPPTDGRVDSDPNASQIRVSSQSEERETQLNTGVGPDQEVSDSLGDAAVVAQTVETSGKVQTGEDKTAITGMEDNGDILPATDLANKVVALAALALVDAVDSDPNITGSRASNHLEDRDTPIGTSTGLGQQDIDPLVDVAVGNQEVETNNQVQADGGKTAITGAGDIEEILNLIAGLEDGVADLPILPPTNRREDFDAKVVESRLSDVIAEPNTPIGTGVNVILQGSDTLSDSAATTQQGDIAQTADLPAKPNPPPFLSFGPSESTLPHVTQPLPTTPSSRMRLSSPSPDSTPCPQSASGGGWTPVPGTPARGGLVAGPLVGGDSISFSSPVRNIRASIEGTNETVENDGGSTSAVSCTDLARKWEQHDARSNPGRDLKRLFESTSGKLITSKGTDNRITTGPMGESMANKILDFALNIGSTDAFIELRQQLNEAAREAGDAVQRGGVRAAMALDCYGPGGALNTIGEIVLLGTQLEEVTTKIDVLQVKMRYKCWRIHRLYTQNEEGFWGQLNAGQGVVPALSKGHGVVSVRKDTLIQLIWPNSDPKSVKRKFEIWVRLGKSLDPIIGRFGLGILYLIPNRVTNARRVVPTGSCTVIAAMLSKLSYQLPEIVAALIEDLHPGIREWAKALEQHLLETLIHGSPAPSKLQLQECSDQDIEYHMQPTHYRGPLALLERTVTRFQTVVPATPTRDMLWEGSTHSGETVARPALRQSEANLPEETGDEVRPSPRKRPLETSNEGEDIRSKKPRPC